MPIADFLKFEECRHYLESELKDLRDKAQEFEAIHERKVREINDLHARLKNSKGLEPKSVLELKGRIEALSNENTKHVSAKKDVQWDIERVSNDLYDVKKQAERAYVEARKGTESTIELKATVEEIYGILSTLERLPMYHHVKDDVPFYDVWVKRQNMIRDNARDAITRAYSDIIRLLNNVVFFKSNPSGWSEFVTSVQFAFVRAVVQATSDSFDALHNMSVGRSLVEAFTLQMKLSSAKRIAFQPMESEIPNIFQTCVEEVLGLTAGLKHLFTSVAPSVEAPKGYPATMRDAVESHADVVAKVAPIRKAVAEERGHVMQYVCRFEEQFDATWKEEISSWDLVRCGLTLTQLEFHWHRFHHLPLVLIDCGPIKEGLGVHLKSRYDELRLDSLSLLDNYDEEVRAGALTSQEEELMAYYKEVKPSAVATVPISAPDSGKASNPKHHTPPPSNQKTATEANDNAESKPEETTPVKSLPAGPTPPVRPCPAPTTAWDEEAFEKSKRRKEEEQRIRVRKEKEEDDRRRAAKEKELMKILEMERAAVAEEEKARKQRLEEDQAKMRSIEKQRQEEEAARTKAREERDRFIADARVMERPSTVATSREPPEERARLREEALASTSTLSSTPGTTKRRQEEPSGPPILPSPHDARDFDRRPNTVASLLDLYKAECVEIGIKPNSGLLKLLPRDAGKFVEEINLDLNYIGIKGIQPLLHILKINRGLKYLNLKDNNLENSEIKALCGVLVADAGSQLRTLDLSNNPVSLGGGNALLDLAIQQKCLRQIHLKGTLIQAKVIDKIQDVLKSRNVD